MKPSIEEGAQFHYDTLNDPLLVKTQRAPPGRCQVKGSTMLKAALILAVLVPACALIGRAITRGQGESTVHIDYPCPSRDQYYAGKKSCSGSTWTFLILAMSWPQTFCMKEGPDRCQIPENVHNWTIHGLWPSCVDTTGPASCNSSAAFDATLVKDLQNDLNKNWPNLLIHTDYYDFWVHEWCKHGTCASSLPPLTGEHNYFSRTLDLYQLYNPYSVLGAAGIVPSDTRTYSSQDFMSAVQKRYSVTPFIGCIKYHKKYYLDEVYICLDRGFKPIDCHVPSRNLCDTGEILYPTVKHG